VESISVLLSYASLIAAHVQGQAEIAAGEYLEADGLATRMQRVGRKPADQ